MRHYTYFLGKKSDEDSVGPFSDPDHAKILRRSLTKWGSSLFRSKIFQAYSADWRSKIIRLWNKYGSNLDIYEE